MNKKQEADQLVPNRTRLLQERKGHSWQQISALLHSHGAGAGRCGRHSL